jgi:hypothetical protein
MVKDLPGPLLFRYSPAILRGLAGTAYDCAREGTLRVYLRGMTGAAARLPGWLRARHAIQRARKVAPARLDAFLERRVG